ncbi:molecular chaperone DnaK [Haliscomenobacter hydrossis]|uniref:Heat shock protein 70 n=1 Tax=Haliscomenobacter hydrossis (strain ATCC 27775 / DSM 1100 / LMG 10767 / O) TaxID=760192 RepID=F4KY30_HALH1|nr:molecular chaperone DnaK [Haliscomenobacter hydrossis]AEE53655.1 Heat shock protein 70 [Haliscomenobacter hydrossis DSM 1100]
MAKFAIDLKSGDIKKETELIVGIDLGTTNSLVAYIKDGQAVAVKGKNGKSTLVPSVVHFSPEGKIVVGDAAKEKLITDPENTIYSVKRLMGKSYHDVEGVQQYFGYKIIDNDTESLVKIRVKDKFYTPTELSAEILKYLKNRIEEELEQIVSKAVITVPAYFNDAQRQATRDAGKLAGLDVLRIVNEPTAASLAYGIGLDQSESHTIAVYDLGGGTFDISILRIQDGVFEVLATNGDTFLGGDDFDRVIVDHWVAQNQLDYQQVTTDKELSQALRLQAEKAKKALSTQDSYHGSVDGITCALSRSQFDQLIQPLVDRTIACCQNAMRDAQVKLETIDRVIMVGGSTRVPLVRNSVGQFFQQEVYDKVNPDEVVALGAAIQADVLAGNQKEILLLDVTPLSLGIETVGGLMDVILPRNSKIPTRVGRRYTTSVDGQRNLKIAVYQGERDLIQHNRKLGEFILKGIPPMPAGFPKVEIHFILNADGILKVKAEELRSNLEQEIEVKPSYGISEEEMAMMLIDSIQNAADDLAVRSLLEARNEANNIILHSERFVVQNAEILNEEELATTRSLTQALRVAVAGNDKDAINSAMESLNTYSAPLAHRAMDVAIADAMKGKQL